jgi:hypothetical protein
MTQKYEHAVRELNRIERMTLPELRAACKACGFRADGSRSALRSRLRLEHLADAQHRALCDSDGYSPEHCVCGSVIDDGPNESGRRTRTCRDSGVALGSYPTTC